MIIGLGTDIIEVPRIGEMIERHGELFLQRVFTDQEIRYCQQRKASLQHFAGRWAAKEAVMKTLGTGFTKGIGWTEIEVVSQTSGRPVIELAGTGGFDPTAAFLRGGPFAPGAADDAEVGFLRFLSSLVGNVSAPSSSWTLKRRLESNK